MNAQTLNIGFGFFVTIIRIMSLFLLGVIAADAQTRPADLIAAAGTESVFQSVAIFRSLAAVEQENEPINGLMAYARLEIRPAQVAAWESAAPKAIRFDVPYNTKNLTIELVKVTLFSENAVIREMPSGRVVRPLAESLHYRGVVQGVPGSIASVSVVQGEVFGLISLPDAGNLVIGRLLGQANYVVYNDRDMTEEFAYTCHTDTRRVVELGMVGISERDENPCAGIWLDVSHEIVAEKGGSAQAQAFIEGLFAQVALLYAVENINLTLSGMEIWTQPEPFANLSQYRDFRREHSWVGNLAHYINYAHAGGLAWQDALCSTETGYGVSGIHRSYHQAPAYSWSTFVVAHEIGHGIGSPHTHDCAWNGNNTPIDGCGSSGCPGELPTAGGTIMSYCFANVVGVDFSQGFGQQPGDLLRSKLAASTCASNCAQAAQTLSAGVSPIQVAGDLAYPNPASDQLMVSTDRFGLAILHIALINPLGVTVYRSASAAGTLQLGVQHLARGIYTVCLYGEKGERIIQRVVLQ